MNRLLFFLALALVGATATAQYWKALGKGTIGPNEVQTIYGDSTSDRLLAGGTFLHIRNNEDTVMGFGQAAWNGTRWDSLATRIQQYGGEGAQPTYWFLRFQEQLYACGSLTLLQQNGEWTRKLARLNAETERWESLGCNVSNGDPIATLVPKSPDTSLYATGYKTGLCGLQESCVFRYDGSAFHPWLPYEQIPDDYNNLVGFVFDFKGQTYMTGSFRDPLSSGYAYFIRWNGTAWEYVPGWGDYYAPIKELLIRNDTLYLAGAFRLANGGPGNGVASFDGENWNDLGGGVVNTNAPSNTVVLGLQWFHDELVVCGRFTQAGGVPCSSIAKWDGHRWCSFPGEIRSVWDNHPTLREMAVWRDSLYVCGGINTIDGDTMRQVVQWIGGDATGECSTVGISETPAQQHTLQVTPLPTPGQWTVHFPSNAAWTLIAYTTAGQVADRWRTTSNNVTIDLSKRSPGLYLLRAASDTGQQLGAKLVRP